MNNSTLKNKFIALLIRIFAFLIHRESIIYNVMVKGKDWQLTNRQGGEFKSVAFVDNIFYLDNEEK